MIWSIYETSTGRLVGRTLSAPPFPAALPAVAASDIGPGAPAFDPEGEFLANNLRAGESAVAGSFKATQYRIVGGIAVDRPPCPITAAVAGLVVTLSGVQIDATVMLEGPVSSAVIQDDPDGSIEITVPAKGRYRITCDCFPARDFDEWFDL